MRRHDEAIAEAKRARELNPLSPESNFELGATLRFSRRYQEAIELLQETIEIYPDHGPTYLQLGWTYGQTERYEEAVASFQEANAILGDLRSKAMLAQTYAILGRRDEALKTLDEMLELEKRSYVPPIYIATIYHGLGESEQALQWFEKAYEVRDIDMGMYQVILQEPFHDGDYDDPGFQDLLRRMNFPE